VKKYLSDLTYGESAKIVAFDVSKIPLKLIEMGCTPGSEVVFLNVSTASCPMYLNIDNCHLAIRRDIAKYIEIELN